MKVKAKTGRDDIALVYIAETDKGRLIEFAESVQPPIPREEKWVLTLSSLFGCPVGCPFCDAGVYYKGKLSEEEILFQIDYLIKSRFPDKSVPSRKFKIQFARMGEPAFNKNVINVLEKLETLYNAPGLMPSYSTVAPKGTERNFESLLEVKNRLYKDKFQLQFSVHTTDEEKRDWLIPVRKWSFKNIAKYGDRFFYPGERKITLNFALAKNIRVDPGILLDYFDPAKFLIKITPVNPTYNAKKNNVSSLIVPEIESYSIIDSLKDAGYEVILSIGDLEENYIGSNCGQFIETYLNQKGIRIDGYSYNLSSVQ